jgi:hypothetical protein
VIFIFLLIITIVVEFASVLIVDFELSKMLDLTRGEVDLHPFHIHCTLLLVDEMLCALG